MNGELRNGKKKKKKKKEGEEEEEEEVGADRQGGREGEGYGWREWIYPPSWSWGRR